MTKRRTDKPPRQYWTPQDRELLRSLYADTPMPELRERFERTATAIQGMAKKLNIRRTAAYKTKYCKPPRGSGIAYRFPKGHVPANKGLRRPGYAVGNMRLTQFKKGQLSHNAVPVGTVLADVDGFWRIKVREREPGERGWHPNVWPCLHHLFYEIRHGPIPPKHMVIFKDRNRNNLDDDNLEMISMAENARRNRMWVILPPELARVAHLNGVLKRRIRSIASGKK